jgi:protein tyrosine/serine phosphatase
MELLMRSHSRLTWLWGIFLTGCLLAPAILGHTDEPAEKARPANWAVKVDRPGLPNLHKINDGLYRGAQPTAEGIRELEKLGVKTIICLRANHSDKKLLGESKIAYEEIPVKTWNPTDEQVARFLQIVADKNRQPIFVHCQHGADRTGTMCAVYRLTFEGWTKQQALDEMTTGGFGYHSIWTNLPKFINQLDVDKVKDKAGLKK